MSDVLSLLANLEDRIHTLVSVKTDYEKKIAMLEEENRKLKAEVASLSEINNKLGNKETIGKLTKAIEQKEDINELRRKINELLHEVNKGLALLVLIQDNDNNYERGDD
jgi:predicted RNase H-like nuclease (RuvC/YqgF family)